MKINLQTLDIAHAQTLYELTELNREHLRTWLPWVDGIRCSEDTMRFIESSITEASDGRSLNYSVLYNGCICGVAGFRTITRDHGIGTIGYWLDQRHCGLGIMSSAVRDIVAVGFDELHLNRIEIRCAENNRKSRAVAERLGFTYEATLRQCEKVNGAYVNHAIYSLLASEYKT